MALLGVTLAIALGAGIVAELRMAIILWGASNARMGISPGEAAVRQRRVDAVKAALPELEREAAELKAKGGCLEGAH